MIENVREAIKNAEAILVFAGAGMSADSNLTTYKDKEGFFNEYPLYRELKKNYISMMSYQGVLADPHFSWGYFAHQYGLYKNAIPHEGYMGLLELCQSKGNYFVVTTNVDGLFIKAGFSPEQVHEVHGSIHKLQCSIPCERNIWATEGLDVGVDYSTMRALDTLPLCPECGFVSRPNICMYGDTDESYVWEEAQESARKFREWREKQIYNKVLIFEIGVGAEGLKRHTKQCLKAFSDAILIRINPEFDCSYAGIVKQIQMGAREAILTL